MGQQLRRRSIGTKGGAGQVMSGKRMGLPCRTVLCPELRETHSTA